MDFSDFPPASTSSPSSQGKVDSSPSSWSFFSQNSGLSGKQLMDATGDQSGTFTTPQNSRSSQMDMTSPALKPFGFPPVLIHRKVSSQDVSTSLGGLDLLAKQGSWRDILEKAKEGILHSVNPIQKLAFTSYHVLALMKLRMYGGASDELAALGDFNSPDYQFESYPDQFSGKKGSMVPFILRWLHADLPHRLGQSQLSIERLYDLLAYCEDKISSPLVFEASPSPSPSFLTNQVLVNSILNPTPSPVPKLSLGPSPSPPPSNWSEANILEDILSTEDESTVPPAQQENPPPETSSQIALPAVPSSDLSDSFSDLAGDTPKEGEPSPSDADVAIPDSFKEFEGVFELGADEGLDSDEEFFKSLDESRGFSGVQGQTQESETPKKSKTVDKWQRRKEFVIFSLIGRHLAMKEYSVAFDFLEILQESHPFDLTIFGQIVAVQLQMGDLSGAENSLEKMEELSQAKSSNGPLDSATKSLLLRTKGLVLFSGNQFSEALQVFDSALQINSLDIVAINNKALCLMYLKDLSGAIKVLEDSLQQSPIEMLNESLVLNLCSMYELACPNSESTKKTLSSWITRIAPDDFDMMCTRL